MREITVLSIALVAGGGAAGSRLDVSERESLAARQTLERYLGAESSRHLDRTVQTVFEIDAALPRLKKHGIMRGVKMVTGAGRVMFTQLHFVGDNLIKTAVIARFLAAETRDKGRGEDLGIAERNYRFHYKGSAGYNGRTALVFRLEPKQRRVGLLQGELWIDAETAEPLREWGELVKSPSALLSHINMVRDYAETGGRARPLRIIVKLKAAFVGPAELTMWLADASAPSAGS